VKDAPDSVLVTRARTGDAAAFGELHRRHAPRARALVRGVLRSDADVEDVTQDALLAAFVDLDRLREPGRFGGWLYAIAANLARMRLRRPGPPAVHAAPEPGIDETLERLERASLVRVALRSLGDLDRRVVVLHYFHGLECREIAAECGLSPGAVRVRLHRARGALRDELASLQPREVPRMTELTIDHVVVRGTEGPEPGPRRVVLLREQAGERVLPIWVGTPEAEALAFALGGETPPRPLPHDLTVRLLEAAGAHIERVTIDRLAEKTFYAVVTVAGAGGTSELDARPSDALNLAARTGAPVFATDEVLGQAGVSGDDLQRELDAIEVSHGLGGEGGEWRPLSAADVRAAWEARMPPK
jgi:RNA polymerase sigma factor (sigma-70 family)